MKRLAILSTHPIQYYAPVFRLLARRGIIEPKVFYTWGPAGVQKYDPGFERTITWDIPLLEDYEYEFLENSSSDPGSHHHRGIRNPDLILRVSAFRPDAILVIGWNYDSHLKAMRYFHGKIPVIFRGDSTLLGEKAGLGRLVRRLALRWVYRYVDFALYVGTQNKRYFLAHGLRERQLIFAPHAVDNARFEDQENAGYSIKALELRTKLGLSDSDLVGLYAGKLEPVKQPEILIRAVQRINRLRSSPVKLVLVGNGSLEKTLRAQAAGDGNILFLDFQNQSIMPAIYRIGDFFCLSSSSETWGLSVNEAMACKKAVLVSDHAGCAVDLVEEGWNGFVFKSGDQASLGTKLELMANDDLLQLGGNAFEKIQDWTFERQCTAIESVCQSGTEMT